jgi:hypothetical protein
MRHDRAHPIGVHAPVADRQDRVEVGSSAYAPVMHPNPLGALLLADFEPTTCTADRARRAVT